MKTFLSLFLGIFISFASFSSIIASASNLDVTPKLMMNPAIEGTEEAIELILNERRSSIKSLKSIAPKAAVGESNKATSIILETGIETRDLSQYTLPQNVFPEPLRTVKVCSGSVKTILEQSPYEISSSSIPVSRIMIPSSGDQEASSLYGYGTVQDMLLAEIESNIETLGTANVAGKLLEQEKRMKNKLEQNHPNITWDWNSVNLDELIHQALEKKYELAYLASLYADNEASKKEFENHNLWPGNRKLSSEEKWAKKLAITSEDFDLNSQKSHKEIDASYLKKLEEERIQHQRALRKIAWGDNNPHAYEHWALPGALESIFFQKTEEKNLEEIHPPEILLEQAEMLGKRLFREMQRKRPVFNNSTSSVRRASIIEINQESCDENLKFIDPIRVSSKLAYADEVQGVDGAQKLSVQKLLDASSTGATKQFAAEVEVRTNSIEVEKQALAEIMAESQKSTLKNILRWTVREKSNQLYGEALAMVKSAKVAREKKSEENVQATDHDDRNSMISKISGSILGVSSVVSNVTGMIKNASQFKEFTANSKDLEGVIKEAKEAEEEWKRLVEDAEKVRIEQGGTLLDSTLVIDAWMESDTKAISTKKEKVIAERREKNWNANTARWKARIQADELAKTAYEAEEKAAELFEAELEIKVKPGAKEKEKQNAIEKATVAKNEAALARTASLNAEKDWYRLAMNHHSLITVESQGEAAIKDALEKLRASDIAVKDLWYNLTSLYTEDQRRDSEEEYTEQKRVEKEIADYKLKRILDMASCFENVTAARIKAKSFYVKAKTPESKAAAKLLYDEVDKLELNALQNYAETVKNDALASARKRIPGIEVVWVEKKTQSEREKGRLSDSLLFKVPCQDRWANENQRDFLRITAIAAADEEAVRSFQKEERRLSDIETLWMAVIEAKKKAAIIRPKNAAAAYEQGDKAAWLTLTPQERDAYNREISEANRNYEIKVVNMIELAEESLAQALREVEKRKYSVKNAVGMSHSKQLAHEALEKSKAELTVLQQVNLEREEALRLGKLSAEEREEIAKLPGGAQDKAAEIERKIEEAKQAFKEGRGEKKSYNWERIATKLEQSRDSWHQVSALMAQGKLEKAFLWRKAAEESEAAANERRKVINAYIIGNEEEAEQLGKEVWSAYLLSDAFTWSLKSEEALEMSNQVVNKDKELWRNIAEQYKIAADYERKASKAHLADKDNEASYCTCVGRSMYSSANYQVKAIQAGEDGNTELTAVYREASEISRAAVEQCKQAVLLHTTETMSTSLNWNWSGMAFQKHADYLVKMVEAQQAGKTMLAAGYREAAKASYKQAEQWKQSAEIKIAQKGIEGVSFDYAAISLAELSEYQVRAAEAQEAGKTALAASYREVVETYQKAAEQLQESALAYAAGNEGEYARLFNEAVFTKQKAEEMVKRVEENIGH